MKTRAVYSAARTYQVHELKSWPVHFQPVADRVKTYEVRKNDRGFKVGDRLWLREWVPDPKIGYTGESLVAEVTHLLAQHVGLTEGYVCMAITVL
jgi:hypothetical protein